MLLAPGTRLGDYAIVVPIGAGGMGDDRFQISQAGTYLARCRLIPQPPIHSAGT